MSKKISQADFQGYPSYSRRGGQYKHSQVKEILELNIGEGLYYDLAEVDVDRDNRPRFAVTLYTQGKSMNRKFSLKKVTSGQVGDKTAVGWAVLRVN